MKYSYNGQENEVFIKILDNQNLYSSYKEDDVKKIISIFNKKKFKF